MLDTTNPYPDLSDEDFRLVAGIAHREAGLLIRPHKRAMVRGRLARRARELGLPSIGAYCHRLKGAEAGGELPGLINALTTNHTQFWREAHHFEHLESAALPAFTQGAPDLSGRVRIWCAAASTGEEPLTIAATALAFAGTRRFADLRILATDIDTDALARAEAATYPRAALEALAPERQARLRPEPAPGGWRPGAALKELIAFRRLNIVEDWPFSGTFEAIFCRNMLIYFDLPTKLGVIRRLAERLVRGGYLYLGHSEALTQGIPGLTPCGRTTYRKG